MIKVFVMNPASPNVRVEWYDKETAKSFIRYRKTDNNYTYKTIVPKEPCAWRISATKLEALEKLRSEAILKDVAFMEHSIERYKQTIFEKKQLLEQPLIVLEPPDEQ
jgi:hypothetical protein